MIFIDRAQTEDQPEGFLKLVMDGKGQHILGAHLVGAGAGEMLAEVALAMQNNLTTDDILGTIHAYPTIASGLQSAILEAYLKSAALASAEKALHATPGFSFPGLNDPGF